jgi:hypothetical protein
MTVRSPSTSELLRCWEGGLDAPPPRRALALLALAWPEAAAGTLARLSIGQRDACLLELREHAFGQELVAVGECPSCGEQLELALSSADVRLEAAPDQPEPKGPLEVRSRGYRVRFRLPDSLDLQDAIVPGDPQATRRSLLDRCLLGVVHEGRPAAPATLPPEVVARVESRMAGADPQADVRLELTCPACAHRWEAPFDIAAFLWAELESWGGRLLYEVHLLALAYGWSEAEILSLGAGRRRFYLEAVAG